MAAMLRIVLRGICVAPMTEVDCGTVGRAAVLRANQELIALPGLQDEASPPLADHFTRDDVLKVPVAKPIEQIRNEVRAFLDRWKPLYALAGGAVANARDATRLTTGQTH